MAAAAGMWPTAASVGDGTGDDAELLADLMAARPTLASQSVSPPPSEALATALLFSPIIGTAAAATASEPLTAAASSELLPSAGSPAPSAAVIAPADSRAAHRPRLVRKPSPIISHTLPASHAEYQPWSWTRALSMHTAAADGSAAAAASRAMPLGLPPPMPVAAPDASAAAAGGVDSVPPLPRRGSLFDDDSMEIDFDAIDVDAIVARAATRNNTPVPETVAPAAKPDDRDIIDLTSSQPSAVVPEAASAIDSSFATTAAVSPAAVMDIEDLASARMTAVPLSLRPSPPLFFVTDFSAMNWCEKQVDLALRLGKRKPPPKAQAVMDAGIAIHLAYELETVEKVNVEIQTPEDVWALRLLNMLMGVQELAETGRTREMPVFGCVQIPFIDDDGLEGTKYMWIMGIIDEVVRLDLFESEMHRKRVLRDAMPPWVPPPPVEDTPAVVAPAPATPIATPIAVKHRSASVSGTPDSTTRNGASEKRKRDDAAELDSLFGAPAISRHMSLPSPAAAPRAIAPLLQPSPSTHDLVSVVVTMSSDGVLITSIAAANSSTPPPDIAAWSQSLIDMDISDDDIFRVLSEDSEQEWKLERQISMETKDQAQVPAKPLVNLKSPPPPVAAPPKYSRSLSLPPLPPPRASPPPPAPSFPVSRHHVVMDHKTRASNSMPSISQKIGTLLQISIYKMLLDRWLGPGDAEYQRAEKADRAMEEKKNASGEPPLHSLLDDPDLPPFPLDTFFTSFKLSASSHLSPPLQAHMVACGLSSELTLGDLLICTLASFKTVHRTYRDMKVEYEFQKDSRHIGSDTYVFDRKWLGDEVHHIFMYWLGARRPDPVTLSDGFKCGRCEYADSCDDRVAKYKRVGRLIVEPPPPEVPSPAAPSGDTDMTDAVASPQPPAPSPLLTDQPNHKRHKTEAKERPTTALVAS